VLPLYDQVICDTGIGKRQDWVTQFPWSRGRCLAWDATCQNTFVDSHVQASSTRAVSADEAPKELKYADITAGVNFIPVVLETSGAWGKHAIELVNNIGRCIAEVTHEPRSIIIAFLRQRISVAIQRGNAFCNFCVMRNGVRRSFVNKFSLHLFDRDNWTKFTEGKTRLSDNNSVYFNCCYQRLKQS
jgi:hypothetical protein